MTKVLAVLAFTSVLLVMGLSWPNAVLVGPGHMIIGGGTHGTVPLQPAGDDGSGSH